VKFNAMNVLKSHNDVGAVVLDHVHVQLYIIAVVQYILEDIVVTVISHNR
jgi:hypothetical protein